MCIMKKFSCIFFFICIFFISRAQNIHYSNFLVTPVLINPAGTCNFDANWRITNVYRSQGGNFTEPYKTNLLGIDKHYRVQNQLVSGSLFYANDVSAINTLKINQIFLTGGYQTNIKEKMILIFGIQASFVHKSNSLQYLTLPEQFDMTTGIFNNNLPSSESFSYTTSNHFEFSSGVIWKKSMKSMVNEVGLAVFNLNNPDEKIMNSTIRLPEKYVLYYMLNTTANDIIIKKYYFYYVFLNKSTELIFGTQLGYKLNEITKVPVMLYLGFNIRSGFNRNEDSMIFAAGIEYINWNVCFNYDYDISGLHNITSNTNALELSIVYTRPNTFLNKKNVPCNIY